MLHTLRSLIIATAILSLFSPFLTPSEAIEITQMYPSYGGYEDYTGSLYHTAYVETDSPYLFVYWYIDDVHQSTSGGPSTSAYFSPNSSDFPGSSDGTTYTIKAVAYQYDPETNLMLSDSDSYSVTVYAPCRETAASLTASVTSCSWTGRTASAEATATVQHTGGDDAPDVEYTFTFGFTVSRIQKNGAAIEDVYAPLPQIKQGRVEPGDAKITKSFSDTYTLGNGWDPGTRFKVVAHITAWGRNAEINGKSEECVDDDSAPFTIPDN